MKSYAPDMWQKHKDNFRYMLEKEFIDLNGRIIACRSRYTGLALPMIGGAMPQALPCFFLNALLPDIAMRQWILLRKDILQDMQFQKDAFWRIDTGNYGFSRASAYAATALAAAELGDDEIKNLCLNALDEECPVRSEDEYFYRPKASVWSHAVEFMARSTTKNSFSNLINTPCLINEQKIIIESASYPSILFSKAVSDKNTLDAVVWCDNDGINEPITLMDLDADQLYSVSDAHDTLIKADQHGKASFTLCKAGVQQINVRKR